MANPRNWHFGAPLTPSKLKWPFSPVWFRAVGPRSIFGRKAESSKSAEVRQGHAFQKLVAAHFNGQAHEGWYVLEELELHAEGYRGTLLRRYVDIVCINPIRGEILVLECKRTYNTSAYEQLWQYMALLRAYFHPDLWKIGGLLVCRGTGVHMGHCVGPTDWLMPGKIEPMWWSGHDLPRIGALDWSMGVGWSL